MWRKFDGSVAPFLCPPKYYYEYYKPLIIQHSKKWVVDHKITDLIFDFVNGELDFSSSFLQSMHYKYLQHALRQRFLLKTAKIKLSDDTLLDENNEHAMDIKHIDANTMDIELIKQMLEDGFSLQEDMQSIWFFSSRSMNSYGFYSSTYKVCGRTKLKSYYDRKFKPIYVDITLKIEGSESDQNDQKNNNTDDVEINSNDIYSLSFNFSDSLELFWLDALDDWDCWKQDDIQAFAL